MKSAKKPLSLTKKKKASPKFLCILNDILNSQAQNGIHQNVVLVDNNNFIPYYFYQSYSYHFSEKQAIFFPGFLP